MGANTSTEENNNIDFIPDGCFHTLRTLRDAWPKVVLEPREEQAKYADAICQEECRNFEFCDEQIKDIRKNFPFSPPTNTTGIGNIAYLSIHGHPEFLEEFENVRNAYSLMVANKNNLLPK